MSALNKFYEERFLGVFLKCVSRIKYAINYLCLKLLCRQVGARVTVISLPRITGGKNICIGDNVFIGRGVHLSATDGAHITIEDHVEIRDGVRLYGEKIVVGAHATLGENAFLVGTIDIAQKCWISRGCDISGEVEIGKAILGPYVRCISSDHGRALDGAICMDQNCTQAKVSIKDGAWVGMNATILKGVTLEKNSVVGAGSVVTRSVAQGRVVAGVPAREIRSGLNIAK
ncbi:MAG: DapH/DapD/GlmU-related protein [Candidatus Omnitrophota bacterium]